MRVQFSIPAYRSIVHTKTALCFGDFLLEAKVGKKWDIGVSMPDHPDVDWAQNMLFKKAMDMEFDVCLMMGSDNHASGKDLVRMIEVLFSLDPKSVCCPLLHIACIAAPCEHRGGGLNVGARTEQGKQSAIAAIAEGKVFIPEKIGLGIVAFRMQWYRDNWPRGPWLRSRFHFGDGAGEMERESQDYTHCEQVQELGGVVLADPRVIAGHEIGMRKGV